MFLMKRPLILSLVLILLVCGCVPAQATSIPAPVTESVIPATQPAVTEPRLIVTPRGDDLVATDPSTVDLVSGVPTLVEFFRFT